MRLRSTGAAFIGGILVASALFFAWQMAGHRTLALQTLDQPAMVRQIQSLSELVSVKYTVQKVVGLEEKKSPVGAEKILLIVQAEVLAGVDLSALTPSGIRIVGDRNIRIALPPPRILHILIDDNQTKVWDRQITWWTPWVSPNPDLERQARLAASKSVEQAALDMGILDQARRNAETVIRNLLQTLGAQSVTVSPT